MKWQPIETAPSDGRDILTIGGRRTRVTLEEADGDYWRWKISLGETVGIPTHWQPVPEPPEQESK